MEITKELIERQLLPKAKKIWRQKNDTASVETKHIFESFEEEFGRKADDKETGQISNACSVLQSYGCDTCRTSQTWCIHT